MTTPIDLESLRGFTPGPWEVGAKGYGAPGYVYCDNSLGSAVAIVYGAPMRHSVFSRAEEEANARLIAAAPSMHAELTARRARDAEVEALVEVVSDMLSSHPKAVTYPDGPCIEKQTRDELVEAMKPFTGAKT